METGGFKYVANFCNPSIWKPGPRGPSRRNKQQESMHVHRNSQEFHWNSGQIHRISPQIPPKIARNCRRVKLASARALREPNGTRNRLWKPNPFSWAASSCMEAVDARMQTAAPLKICTRAAELLIQSAQSVVLIGNQSSKGAAVLYSGSAVCTSAEPSPAR